MVPLLLIAPCLFLYVALFVWPQIELLAQGFVDRDGVSLVHYTRFFSDSYNLNILLQTLLLGFVVTAITLVFGVPSAYLLARMESRWAPTLLMIATIPLLISVVVRSFGWMVLFFRNGVVSQFVVWMGVAEPSYQLMYTLTGVSIALAQVLLPIMIITLYGVFRSISVDLEYAATSLGATPTVTFFLVTLRLARDGMIAGSMLVFALAISTYATPSLIGGARVKVMATSIYEQSVELLDWPFAAALSTILLIAVVILAATSAALIARQDTKEKPDAR